MGKKRKNEDIEDVLAKPWCYYCERQFEDLKILISHQKAKHFKCERCGRRLNTAGGLSVHLNQVHKETLTEVDNALPERKGLGVEIFGMEGIPDDIKQRHDKRVAENYWKEQASRREATGNPPAGSKEALAVKPSKFGDDEDLLKRFKEHLARIENGDTLAPAAIDGVQPVPAPGIPPSVSPDQAQPFAPPPFQPAPIGFPPVQAPFPGQPPFQPPFAGSPPFAHGPYQPPPVPGGSNLPSRPAFPPHPAGPMQQAPPGGNPAVSAAVDDLISSAQAAAAPTPPPAATSSAPAEKKGKEKNVRLVYSDNEVSPEEKMAARAKYAFVKS
ncbi:hypothetical protein, variant 2 [Verruconis gallopava]|uniref:C2H2-type domain-containing protein n=1 Tax=Verruconis gallopava TaxID=253628 RepID=A0A0D2ARG0_9PEZI|nr:uncharacterized protein PV09_00027 [Verruconis gallopava]XP_016218949.1 hypothetical protein, variant 1 [Verruconis gallopava]XP_016218950.1 hypothetical protein, variant 2 [Verruconis gallopava]KIW09079.1 hypothetical protein PV09_00027 [Verruconis gallopava]KIW09080.1 hypothetical protein, variant 1 [Verruconis gallopava]KIW09081.1 hypothetical protein, variant 2 [Verruconis gallopava]